MLVIPAIDLKDEKVIRLTQGRFNRKIVYSDDPIKTACSWQAQGAKFLHIVDLDGASCGSPRHLDILKKILKNIKIPVELGGGIRDISTIKRVLKLGISRAVVGSKLEDRDFLERVYRDFKDKIIPSIDVRGNKVSIAAWRRSHRLDPVNLIKSLEQIGFRTIIYTDISRDGTLKGPNIFGIKRILEATRLDIIISGGIGSLADINKLKAIKEKRLVGAIVGKALYENRFSLKEAIEVINQK